MFSIWALHFSQFNFITPMRHNAQGSWNQSIRLNMESILQVDCAAESLYLQYFDESLRPWMFVVVVLNKQIIKQLYSDSIFHPTDNEYNWIRIRNVLRPHCIGQEGAAGSDLASGPLGQEADESSRLRDQHRTIRGWHHATEGEARAPNLWSFAAWRRPHPL